MSTFVFSYNFPVTPYSLDIINNIISYISSITIFTKALYSHSYITKVDMQKSYISVVWLFCFRVQLYDSVNLRT